MRETNNYSVRLTSYNESRCWNTAIVGVECEEYELFKEIIDAVKPILDREQEKINKGSDEAR